MTTPTKEQQAVEKAQELAKTCKSATDLQNAFFGIGGVFGRLFPTRAEREAFVQTPEYRAILQIRKKMLERDAVTS